MRILGGGGRWMRLARMAAVFVGVLLVFGAGLRWLPGPSARPGPPPAGWRWVRVVDEDGAPLAGVEYDVGTGPQLAAADGIIAFPSGDYETPSRIQITGLHTRLGDLLGKLTPVGRAVFELDEALAEQTIRIGPPQRLRGRVERPDGTGLADAVVTAGDEFDSSWGKSVTDDDGWFEIDGAGPGEWAVTAQPPPGWLVRPGATLVRPGETARIPSWPVCEAHVRIEAPDGSPVRARVVAGWPGFVSAMSTRWFDQTAGGLAGDRTDAEGMAVLAGLPTGVAVSIVVQPDGEMPYRVEQVEREPGDHVIRLVPGHSVSGRVTTPEGQPIPDAEVYIAWSSERGAVASVLSGPDGEFRLAPFGPSEAVRAAAALWSRNSPDPPVAAFETVAGRPGSLSVVLDAGRWVRVRGDLRAGRVIVRASPTVGVVGRWHAETASAFMARIDADARPTFAVQSEGRWFVARNVSGANTDVTVAEVETAPLAGIVLGAAEGVSVSAVLDGVELCESACDDSGAFRFDGLPRGEVSLVARSGRNRRWLRDAVPVGGPPVTLDLPAK